LYRAMAWLGQPLKDQAGATPFAPRTTKDRIEEALFARRQDLFTTLDLVFFDTTSIYFEGEGGDTVGQYGHSKDHRPDRRQMVVGLVIDADGHPLCCELWPGNATDVKSLVPIVDRLRTRFHIREVCIVADRGMISQAVLDEIEGRDGWSYILGVRMRAVKVMRELLAADDGPYETVFARTGDPTRVAPLKVREVDVDGHDYVLCLNEDEATKDRHDRAAIVAALRDALHEGDTALVGNKGYRRYLKSTGHRFAIDDEKIALDARYDGKWVLTTNTGLDPRTTALAYKQLWMVERLFRSMKSVLETRPIYHKCDETIRGHVFCSFLALVLRKELEDRLAARHWKLEWHDVVQDLDRLEEVTITVDEKSYVLRTEPKGTVGKVFQAAGVALPPVIRPS
jgi:transposase